MFDPRTGPILARPGSAPPTDVLRFELKADLEPGGSAYAYQMKADGSDADTEGETLLVYDDSEGNRRARGRDSTGYSGSNHGARGKAWYNDARDRWEIVSLQVLARMCSAKTTGQVDRTAVSFTVDNVVPLDDGQSPVSGSSETVLVDNQIAKWQTKIAGTGVPLIIWMVDCTASGESKGHATFIQSACLGDQ
jgi:hypothetical protein